MGNFSFFSNFSRTLPWLVFILGNKNLLLYFLFFNFCLCMEYILCLDQIYFWNIQAIRPAEYSNLIQAWNISLNISLHRYKIFQWPQNCLADFETAAIRKWHYYSTRCVSTYFHIPGGVCTLSGTLKLNWRAGETHSIFIITSRIWNNSVWSLQNPMLFQAHLSVCHAVVSCHKTVITVSLMWQCWGHWQRFLAQPCSDFAWQVGLLQWQSHGSSASMGKLPSLSLLMSSTAILTSGCIPTPFEISLFPLTVDLSYLLMVFWAIILSTTCYFYFFWKVLGKDLCGTECLSK